jgi:flagellar basal-body rod modification protein FlgD
MTISVASNTTIGSATPGGTMGDFLKILSAQLNSQDPLKPVDNQEFIAQIAQFTALEQTQQLNAKIDSLLAMESVAQAVGLLGRMVDANGATGAVTGRISGLSLQGDIPALTLTLASGQTRAGIALSDIVNIR